MGRGSRRLVGTCLVVVTSHRVYYVHTCWHLLVNEKLVWRKQNFPDEPDLAEIWSRLGNFPSHF